MRTPNKVLLSWAAALFCASVLIWAFLAQRGAASGPASAQQPERVAVQAQERLEAPPRVQALPLPSIAVAQGEAAESASRFSTNVFLQSQTEKKPLAPTPPQVKRGKPELLDPLARVALAFVGADPVAEAYWCLAINDPSLPAVERQDLIEDLNEDGLSDPKHPSVEDLPLIVSRLAIIEDLAPDAMDSVNGDALAEAYKDLVNLAALVVGEGEPVK